MRPWAWALASASVSKGPGGTGQFARPRVSCWKGSSKTLRRGSSSAADTRPDVASAMPTNRFEARMARSCAERHATARVGLLQAARQELLQPLTVRLDQDFARHALLFDLPLVQEDRLAGHLACEADF